MLMRVFEKIVGWALGRRKTPSYADVALGHVAETLAAKVSEEAADDIARLRESKLTEAEADSAQNQAKIASAEAATNADNAKKVAASQEQCASIEKRLADAKSPAERQVLLMELEASRVERVAEAYERFAAARTRIRAMGGDISFRSPNLDDLSELGNNAAVKLIEGPKDSKPSA